MTGTALESYLLGSDIPTTAAGSPARWGLATPLRDSVGTPAAA
jgi:hypothetical protein